MVPDEGLAVPWSQHPDIVRTLLRAYGRCSVGRGKRGSLTFVLRRTPFSDIARWSSRPWDMGPQAPAVPQAGGPRPEGILGAGVVRGLSACQGPLGLGPGNPYPLPASSAPPDSFGPEVDLTRRCAPIMALHGGRRGQERGERKLQGVRFAERT